MIVCYYVPSNKLMRFNKRIVNPLKIHKWLVIFFVAAAMFPQLI